jgi:hypothetical protein
MKTVTLPAETWAKLVRRLTVEVGANDESRAWARAIEEQASGAVIVKVSRSGIRLATKNGDLRSMSTPDVLR